MATERLKIQLHQRAIGFQLAVIIDVSAVPDCFSKGIEVPIAVLPVSIGRHTLQPVVIDLPAIKKAVLIAISFWGFYVEISQWIGALNFLLHIDIAARLVFFVGIFQSLIAKISASVKINAVIVVGCIIHTAFRRRTIIVVAFCTRQSVLETLHIAINACEGIVALGSTVIAALQGRLQWFGATFARHEVHHAAKSARTVQHRTRTSQNLYTLHHCRVQCKRCAHLVVVSNLLAINQNGRAPGFLAAYANAPEAGLARVSNLDAGDIPQHFREAGHRGPGQLLFVDHAKGSGTIKNTLLRSAGCNYHFFQLTCCYK